MSPSQERTHGSLPSVEGAGKRLCSSASMAGATSTARMSCTPRPWRTGQARKGGGGWGVL